MERANVTYMLTLARRKASAAANSDKIRWLLIVALLEGYQCQTKPGSSTSEKAS